MARVTRREWYRRVNAAWPAVVPELTAEEAVRAFRRLYRFAFKQTFTGRLRVTSGNRRTGRGYRRVEGVLYRFWYVNPAHGWKDLVHILSHYAERGAHGGKHARMELRMIKQVVRRGWLDGVLKAVPKPVPPPIDVRAARQARLQQRLVRWEVKQRRAVTAIRKLHRQLRYYERLAA